MRYDSVVLVDKNDQMLGTMEKMAAHSLGRLHRAISVFVFNTNGELLLQQRAWGKYHSGGKWSNTCCSHPRPGEATSDTAHRRLREEMGLTCELDHAFSFIYRADMGNGLTEYEFDHVYIGTTCCQPQPDGLEVGGVVYRTLADIQADLDENPEKYTAWFKVCFDRVVEFYNQMVN